MRRYSKAQLLFVLIAIQVLLPSRPTVTASGTYEQRVVELINQERMSRGLGPLVVHDLLVNAAEAHSADLSAHGICQHDSTDGTPWYERIRQYGYTPNHGVAENVACGYLTPEQVVSAWMSSAGHWENILGDYVHVGVGYYANYWTMDLGKPAPGTPPACVLEHDFNGNGIIGADDIQIIAQNWSADPPADPMYDVNYDQCVDVVDVMVVSSEWGMTCQ